MLDQLPDSSLVIITGHGLLQRSNDTTFPYRQDSNYWYLTGIDEPDIIVVFDRSSEFIMLPARSEIRDTFDGQIDRQELARRSGITDILDSAEGWQRVRMKHGHAARIATLKASDPYVESMGFYTNPARVRLMKLLRQELSSVRTTDIRPYVASLRAIKQPQEVAAIKAAIELTSKSLLHMKNTVLMAGKHEYELEASITGAFRAASATHAYEPIVAAGANACTLHYTANKSPVKDGDLVLLDVGAEVEQYAADITRTYAVSEVNSRQREVHAAVKEAHAFALTKLKPGILMKEYEKEIETYMGGLLKRLGLIKKINHKTVRHYYPHATSHFLGLDVHDVGDYQKPLMAGMVLTVEPGIYIPEEAIGIRLEDDVLLTESGNQVLSMQLPLDCS